MVTLDWDLDRTDGVTLVRAYVTAERPRRVRVANRLDGPVWPPRRRGQPAPGWDDDEFEGVVTPGDRLVVGYATPAPPDDPPVAVVGNEPATESEAGADGALSSPDEASTPAGVVRSLGDPVVPRDAVPIPDADAPQSSRDGGVSSRPGVAGRSHLGTTDGRRGTDTAEAAALVVPGAVRDWIRDLDRRLTAAERRQRRDGRDAALAAAVATDVRALDRAVDRLDALRARADGLDCGRRDREQAARQR
jgi:hypothetical protein